MAVMTPAIIPISFIIYLDQAVWSRESVPVSRATMKHSQISIHGEFVHIFSAWEVIIRNSRCIFCVCPFDRKQLSCCAPYVWKAAVVGIEDLNSLTFNLMSVADNHTTIICTVHHNNKQSLRRQILFDNKPASCSS